MGTKTCKKWKGNLYLIHDFGAWSHDTKTGCKWKGSFRKKKSKFIEKIRQEYEKKKKQIDVRKNMLRSPMVRGFVWRLKNPL